MLISDLSTPGSKREAAGPASLVVMRQLILSERKARSSIPLRHSAAARQDMSLFVGPGEQRILQKSSTMRCCGAVIGVVIIAATFFSPLRHGLSLVVVLPSACPAAQSPWARSPIPPRVRDGMYSCLSFYVLIIRTCSPLFIFLFEPV